MPESLFREALRETASALRLNRPVLAVLVAIVAFAAGWALTGQPGWGAVAALAASVALFVPLLIVNYVAVSGRRVIAAEGRIAELEKSVADRRDPDGIYQLGTRVANAVHATVVRQQSIVHFAALQDAHELDLDRPFEYREFVLEPLHVQDGGMIVRTGNQKPDRTIGGVTCRIVGLRD